MSEANAVIAPTPIFAPKLSGATRISVLGAGWAGKSSFLAGLAILGEPNRHSGLTLVGRDSATQTTLSRFAKMLRDKEWPPSTTATNLLKLQLAIDGMETELQLLDYPGEDFQRALADLNPEVNQEFQQFLRSCNVLVLLFDPQLDLHQPNPEMLIERQTAHLNAIVDLARERQASAGVMDVAVVLTKVDRNLELIDSTAAKKYFLFHAAALNERLAERALSIAYFPLSAVGRPGSAPTDDLQQKFVPNILEPYGYEDLFRWVLSRQRDRQQRRRIIGSLIVAVGLIVVLLAVHLSFQASEKSELAVVTNPASPIEKVAETGKNSSHQKVMDAAIERLREHLQRQNEQLDKSVAPGDTKSLVDHLAQLGPHLPSGVTSEFDELLAQTHQKLRKQRLNQIQAAFESGSSTFPELADRFLIDFPSCDEAGEAKKLKGDWHTNRRKVARNDIHRMVVSTLSDLREKQRRIEEYIKQFAEFDSKEIGAMRRATELARQFCEPHSYQVSLKRSGGFNDKRWHIVKVSIDGQLAHEARSPNKAAEINWLNQTFPMNWKAGQKIQIELWDDWTPPFSDGLVGMTSDNSPAAISMLGRKAALAATANYTNTVRQPFVACTIDKISEDDWNHFRRFITPGDGWK